MCFMFLCVFIIVYVCVSICAMSASNGGVQLCIFLYALHCEKRCVSLCGCTNVYLQIVHLWETMLTCRMWTTRQLRMQRAETYIWSCECICVLQLFLLWENMCCRFLWRNFWTISIKSFLKKVILKIAFTLRSDSLIRDWHCCQFCDSILYFYDTNFYFWDTSFYFWDTSFYFCDTGLY